MPVELEPSPEIVSRRIGTLELPSEIPGRIGSEEHPMVDSRNIYAYCMPKTFLPADKGSLFASQIILPSHKPFFAELRAYAKKAHAYTEDQRRELLRRGADVYYSDPRLQQHVDKLRAKNGAVANELQPVEAAIIDYYDPTDNSFYASYIVDDGLATEIISDDAQELIDEGMYPVIIWHLHNKGQPPRDEGKPFSPFSPVDLLALRKAAYEGDPEEGDIAEETPLLPQVRGIGVIDPTGITLALLTAQTPKVMTESEKDDYLNRSHARLEEEDEEQKALKARYREIADRGDAKWRAELKENRDLARALVAKQQETSLIVEEEEQLAAAYARLDMLTTEEMYNPDDDPEYRELKRQYLEWGEDRDRQVRLELAQEMQVEIYRSTDDEVFNKVDLGETFALAA